MQRTLVRQLIAGCITLGALGTAQADPNYPSKPVTIIVPFAVGGDADQSARNLGVSAQELLKQTMVTINRAGANGAIGSLAVATAPPDGYTLLLSRVGSQVILPSLRPPSSLKYAWNDFTVIGLLELNPVVCVVHPESPYRTFGDLTKALVAQPGKLTYSSAGPATVQNLAPQLLLRSLNLKPDGALGIQYKGGSEASLAVMSKEVNFSCNNLSSMAGQIAGGKLRALVTTTPERVKQLPDVPTASEAGYPALEAVIGWSALVGPPKMDPEIVKRWAAVLQKVSTDPRWVQANDSYGGIPRILSPAESAKFIEKSYEVYKDLVAKAGIQLE